MGRPRDPSILSRFDMCELCGHETEWRFHRVGKGRNGLPRSRWRCMECHARRNRKGHL